MILDDGNWAEIRQDLIARKMSFGMMNWCGLWNKNCLPRGAIVSACTAAGWSQKDDGENFCFKLCVRRLKPQVFSSVLSPRTGWRSLLTLISVGEGRLDRNAMDCLSCAGEGCSTDILHKPYYYNCYFGLTIKT